MTPDVSTTDVPTIASPRSAHDPAAPVHVPLDERTLQRRLDESVSTSGWRARVLTTTPSTNATLLQALRDRSLRAPCALATDVQTAGRGRRGRAWRSAPGASLTVSFALASRRDLASLGGVTLACGLAVREVLVALGVRAMLKWPNDVVVDDAKLAGILVESLVQERTVLVVGVGINVCSMPVDDEAFDAPYRATDLARCGVVSSDRHLLTVALAGALEERLRAFDATGFASMVDEYDVADAYRDRRVVLSGADGSESVGFERGVDERGALRLDTATGLLAIVAGDVSLRLAGA